MTWMHKISSPIMPDYLDNLHDPDLRRAMPPSTKIMVYHGTTSKRLALVLQTGFFDPQIADKSFESASPGIFVTTSLGLGGAELFAHHAANGDKDIPGDGGDEIVVELVVPFGWIEQDPDDTRIDPETGKMNQMGRQQGRIMHPVKITHIRQIMIKNDIISTEEPHPLHGDFMYSNTSQWVPIGKMLDLIKRHVYSLPEEYGQMINVRPRGLSRTEAPEERESKLASDLLVVLHTFLSIGVSQGESSDFVVTLAWIYENKIQPWSDAISSLSAYFEHMSPGSWEEVSQSMSDRYAPIPGEHLYRYLARVK